MAHHKKHNDPVPPGNQPQAGNPGIGEVNEQAHADTKKDATFQARDAKRRLGDFKGAGEPSYQQPGGKNDANH